MSILRPWQEALLQAIIVAIRDGTHAYALCSHGS